MKSDVKRLKNETEVKYKNMKMHLMCSFLILIKLCVCSFERFALQNDAHAFLAPPPF